MGMSNLRKSKERNGCKDKSAVKKKIKDTQRKGIIIRIKEKK